MPFTPTHIAAILPISLRFRHRLPCSALVIGSQIPDLPLYVPRLFPFGQERVLHSFEGLLAGCLPLGFLGYLWFQLWVKEALFDALPLALRQRLVPWRKPRLEPRVDFFLGVLLAIALGAATHVVWDSFTHYGNWGYHLVPAMGWVVTGGPYEMEVYKVLQHGSTLLFLPPMALALVWWLRQLDPCAAPTSRLASRQRTAVQASLLLLPALGSVCWCCYVWMFQQASLRALTVEFLTTLGMLQLVSVNIYAAWHVRQLAQSA